MRYSVLVLLMILCLLPLRAEAQGRTFNLIRDTEIEQTLHLYADPLLRAAGLNPKNVGLHIVNDKKLNAFVTNGQNIYIHAGLLIQADTPEQVMGVLAHETGHMAGGHLAQFSGQVEKAQTTSISSVLLGAAAGLLTKNGELAQAIIAGGQQVATQQILGFSRAHERAADQAGITYLDEAGYSSQGFYEFMKKLQSEALLIDSAASPYLLTHPPAESRVGFLRHHVEQSPLSNKMLEAHFYERHGRMRAKLKGFLQHPSKTLRDYGPAMISVEARYARTIAYYKNAELDKALIELDTLLAQAPNDPYFHELQGQILFENGKIAPAIAAYERAQSLLGDAPLIRISLAEAQLADRAQSQYDAALDNLKVALNYDPRNRNTWRLMAVAYGQKGDLGRAQLAHAEYLLLGGKTKEALAKASAALDKLPANSPDWYRASDIIHQTEDTKD